MRKLKTCTKSFVTALLLAFLLPAVTQATSKTLNPPAVQSGQTNPWYLVAELADGNEIAIPMSTVGSLVAVDDAYEFTVLNGNGSVIQENVMKVVFKTASELDPSAIRDISVLRNMLGYVVSDRLTLIGVSGEVSVFDASGKEQLSTVARGGETIVSVAHLPSGVYMLKCDKQTFKFMKK
ncbi:MAG: T9SS type A sorting domain-containing protein [Prevotella sp.]|nr:T9SS type A sorting domain-containing protein [Prevotella sp.]